MTTLTRTALAVVLMLALTTHWRNKETERVREFITLRAEQPNAVLQACEHFDMSEEEVRSILTNKETP